MVPGFRDDFAAHAGDYATHRPGYPPALVARLASLAPSRALAWDVGTGSGQAAILLAAHFDRVLASDASVAQLARARAHPRVEYVLALAEQSALGAATADIVTVAQALHWFDLGAFYAEAERVLRPGGVLAAWTYALPVIDAEVDATVRWFHSSRIGRYWPEGRRHVDEGYRSLPFPYAEIGAGDYHIEARLSRDQFLGYVGTWSAVARAREAERGDPVEDLEARLRPAWPDREDTRTVRWPLAVRAGRKPG